MKLTDRIPLLFNPKAGTLKTMSGRASLMQAATEFILLATASAEEAESMAHELAGLGHPIIAAAGGDGTLNKVVAGLRGTGAALGVVPGGTMNVFARELGLAPDDLDAAIQVVSQRHIGEVDLFEANGVPFLQMAGFGFDARVIELTGELKDKIGPMAYIAGAIQALGEKPPQMSVRTNEGEEVEGAMVLAGNGGLYGGELKLFAHATHDDGMLDLLVFPKPDAGVLWDMVKGVFQGGVGRDSDRVRYLHASEVEITSDCEVPLELDGEFMGSTSRLVLKACPERLKVVEPADLDEADG